METTHNPDRYMADLRQLLSQGRKRIGVLAGAGAPLSIRVNSDRKLDPNGNPLIPGIEELTKLALETLGGDEKKAVNALIKNLENDKAKAAKAKAAADNLKEEPSPSPLILRTFFPASGYLKMRLEWMR